MINFKIKNGDKYFEIYQREFYDPLRRMGWFIATEEGEGMEINEEELYDFFKAYFKEFM